MIRDYKKGDLPSNYEGVRVAVSVAGKVKQKWFSNKKYANPTALIMAKEQEQKWMKMQKKHQQNAVFSKKSNTGITGLSFTTRINHQGNGRVTQYNLLYFTYMKKGQITSTSWHIDIEKGISDEIWEKVALLIKNTRTLTDDKYEKLRQSRPDAVAFFAKKTPGVKTC